MKMRKNLRKGLNQSIDIKERQDLKDRIRIIKEHIVDRNKEIRAIKVKKLQNRSDETLTRAQKSGK